MEVTLKDSQRFFSKVEFHGEDDCWIWRGAIKDNGYGNFYAQGKNINAHKAAFIFAYGCVPEGSHLMHTCDNRVCVNPHHIKSGTRQQNMDDMVSKGRASHGSMRWNTFLSELEVAYIRQLFDRGISVSNISSTLGMKYQTVYQIAKRKRWIEKA